MRRSRVDRERKKKKTGKGWLLFTYHEMTKTAADKASE